MHVNKWLKNEKVVKTPDLLAAAKELINGKFDANLGGGLYKKRISNSSNKGKSGGSRLLIAYKKRGHIFFMYAFNKNDSENISAKEKLVLKERAKIYFSMTDKELEKAIKAKVFVEIQEK